MSENLSIPLISPLCGSAAQLSHVGGKGASLARLAAAGLPVPAAFVVTTEAYRRFVSEGGLSEKILAAVAETSGDRPDTFEAAAQTIRALFAGRAMDAATAAAVRGAYARMAEASCLSRCGPRPRPRIRRRCPLPASRRRI